jgi:myo-inositol-1(or 4)-monophosphatase
MDTEFVTVAENAARAGGRILQQWSERFTVTEKSPANLVTEADFESQEIILRTIRAQYPEHSFLGEEGLSESNPDSDYRWIIDPLDGTSNYVHHFPYYAVSIGLQRADSLIAGVIFDPTRDEMFSACRGCGATLNGDPIQPSGVDDISHAMAVASLPIAADKRGPAIARFLRVLESAQTVQRTGSAALNLAYVAAGRLDAFWSSSLKPWDVAAGALIVDEAGGCATRMDGNRLQIEIPDILATNGRSIHQELQRLLSDVA